MELKIGRTYRGKNPRNVAGLINDRTIVWMDSFGTTVQFDGPAVVQGRLYPKIARDKFVAWADRDVTDKLPEGKYAPWVEPPKWEEVSRNERSLTVNGRHYFAFRCSRAGAGWRIDELDAYKARSLCTVATGVATRDLTKVVLGG